MMHLCRQTDPTEDNVPAGDAKPQLIKQQINLSPRRTENSAIVLRPSFPFHPPPGWYGG